MSENKNILGLDLGTNSIGWAMVNYNQELNTGNILGAGSRIIPMDAQQLNEFESGAKVSSTAERTQKRGVRRLRERALLRRNRLNMVLDKLQFLPKHYSKQLDRFGKFTDGKEVRISGYTDELNNYQFVFENSFQEMLQLFYNSYPDLQTANLKIPRDWTIYYLRKKALTQKIEKEELAWILLQFNQKRGYYQLRGEDEADKKERQLEEYFKLKVTNVLEMESTKKPNEKWYQITLENGWLFRKTSKVSLEMWVGKEKEFIVTTELNEDGSEKLHKETKEVQRRFRVPNAETDWKLMKKRTEFLVEKSNKTVGEFIFDNLLDNRNTKIIGQLIKTIERKYYKTEIESILHCQTQFHRELVDSNIYSECLELLYANNEQYRKSVAQKDLKYLFIDNILFYQRPLKSKKSLISNCPLEKYKVQLENNETIYKNIKCIHKSNPIYQEFRIWQWLNNLKIYEKEKAINSKIQMDVDVTTELLKTESDYEKLFEFLINKKEIDQESLLKFLLEQNGVSKKDIKLQLSNLRWNYVDKPYPCAPTNYLIATIISKKYPEINIVLNADLKQKLWHILYSVTDKYEIESALKKFALKNEIENIELFIDAFKSIPPFKSEYGSYSEKAIKKLLPFMRLGKYWSIENFNKQSLDKINKIITAEDDKNISNRVREKCEELKEIKDFKFLPEWITKYIVYNRHSESHTNERWSEIEKLEEFIHNFKQHSLRNPVVESIVLETLRVIREIWKNEKYGNKKPSYFNEIHIELGREMKNNAEDRKKIAETNLQNQITNERIRTILTEFANLGIAEVRPYSPMQQEALRIYEDGVLNSEADIPDDILKISKSAKISSADILKYKLWLDQKYVSPYTKKVIPLNKLFTTAYEIEHIIPKSVYYDDSFSNKVICESEVNKLKDRQFGYEFIKNHGGEIVQTSSGSVQILKLEEYDNLISDKYAKNKSKAKKLRLEEVPEQMIDRQLNDTRYISKYIKNILSNIVRANENDDGFTSKNIISCNGSITSQLKNDWGINSIWSDLMLPRFERLNRIHNTTEFTVYNERYQKYLPSVPAELKSKFQLKRIDHRHHAMDAIVIACTTRSHINYLNNVSALSKVKSKEEKEVERHDLRVKLCVKRNIDDKGNYKWMFKKPWENFTLDTKNVLENMIVSFKQNLRIINKTVNYYEKIVNGKKEKVKQTKGDNWAIRKPLHKETIYGAVNIKERTGKFISLNAAIDDVENIVNKEIKQVIKSKITELGDVAAVKDFYKKHPIAVNSNESAKIEMYQWSKGATAARKKVDISFTKDYIENKVTDSGIKKILLNHLNNYENNVDEKGKSIAANELAFSPEGLDEMNKNIIALNNGKFHQPIYSVRIYESGNKFPLGTKNNKSSKFVEAEKGTNLFFVCYEDNAKEILYDTMPLNIIIKRLKSLEFPIPNIENFTVKYYLSPGDTVETLGENGERQYFKMVSCSKTQCFFTPLSYSNAIIENEIGVGNKNERIINFIALNYSLDADGKLPMIKRIAKKMNINIIGEILNNDI